MIVERLLFAVSRDYAIEVYSLKEMKARDALDGRIGYPKELPSDDAIRAFRARHHDLTVRAGESKEASKLRAENSGQVQGFFKIYKVSTRSIKEYC